MEAMIFAAGLGTRLYPITQSIPKALVEVGGHTLLELNIQKMIAFGIKKIIVNVHHFPDMIIEYIASKNFDCEIIVSDERNELLNTGGGFINAKKHFSLQEDILLHNADILSSMDFALLEQAHNQNKSTLATLAVKDRETSRYLLFDENNILCGHRNNSTMKEKIKRNATLLKPLAFSGIQIVSPKIFDKCTLEGKFSMIDLYLSLAKDNEIKAFQHDTDLWIDVGKQGSIEKATELFAL